MNRRSVWEGLALGATTVAAGLMTRRHRRAPPPPRSSNVAVIRCGRYDSCHGAVRDGLRAVPLDVQGKRVVLKPNLVEYSAAAPINTHPKLIAAVADELYRSGAASVVVADGPGHVRDTQLLLDESGLGEQLARIGHVPFVDLNFDRAQPIAIRRLTTTFTELWLPSTILSSDVLISMPKLKTHHWAGVTLSLKNLFGVVPGSVYGWPKNVLHWQGIDNSIVELAAAVPIHYVIADGIEAMEGNGPLHGPARHLGAIVFADEPVAADATCCRLMGIDPSHVRHLVMASLGNLSAERILQRGEPLEALRQDFNLLSAFAHLRNP